MIEENPSFDYRTVARLLSFNKNKVQRVFQLMGWQVRKRPVALDVAYRCFPQWLKHWTSTGQSTCVGFWRQGWLVAHLALVIGCHTRELLEWHLSRSTRSKTAEAALEKALITRYGCLVRVSKPFLPLSDNGLVFTSRSYAALVKSYGLQQQFITPDSPEQNGMVERVIRTLKEQCAHRLALSVCNTPVGSLVTGLAFTTIGGHIRRWV